MEIYREIAIGLAIGIPLGCVAVSALVVSEFTDPDSAKEMQERYPDGVTLKSIYQYNMRISAQMHAKHQRPPTPMRDSGLAILVACASWPGFKTADRINKQNGYYN